MKLYKLRFEIAFRPVYGFCAMAALGLFLLPLQGRAETSGSKDVEPKVTWGTETDLNARYLWRGLDLSGGAVVQPSAWVTASGTTLNIWANDVLKRHATGKRLNEVDYTVSHPWEKGRLRLEPSFVLYTYPRSVGAPNTGEVSVKLATSIGKAEAFLRPTVDVVHYGGTSYWEGGLGIEKELRPRLSTEATWTLGWGSSRFNRIYVGRSGSRLNVSSLSATATYTNAAGFYFRPHAEWDILFNRALKDQAGQSGLFNVGIAAGREF